MSRGSRLYLIIIFLLQITIEYLHILDRVSRAEMLPLPKLGNLIENSPTSPHVWSVSESRYS